MNKFMTYKSATWALLALNVIVLAFFVFIKPTHQMPPNPLREFAKTEMNLDENQYQLFIKSADKHRKQIIELETQQNDLLQKYFSHLIVDTLTNNNAANNDENLAALQSIEKQKIELTYQHFVEIKSLLKPTQYESYAVFLQKALDRFFKKNKKNRKPPKD